MREFLRHRFERHVRERLDPSRREWEHVPEGWTRVPPPRTVVGWDIDEVVAAYRARLGEFRAYAASTAPIGVSTSSAVGPGDASPAGQNNLLMTSLALALAARGSDAVSVLDWGGGFGYHRFVARAFLPDDLRIDYAVRELPRVAEAGRIEVPEVEFFADDECFARTYDLTMAVSSLQYARDWEGVLGRLGGSSRRYVFLGQMPTVHHVPSFVVLQRTARYRFRTEYLSWVCNRNEVVEAAEAAGLRLVREFVCSYRPFVHGAPEQPDNRGYLFTRTG